mmetsp:Transcript_14566/g.35191  ORF Transcript_14566/g.35191 Transcript_14566/m.35191 type:complete len:192 (+) Transcript_14566:67-642(+)|eukprot:CAMPEP_0180142070 /NCGR_PEP_ID=MMETSP0986-20121125/15353_1 /TAXON_ID=697907 /ORGANISM="non described non described, Strain CCMP2293" /LENGTH=191 /DNA_ID=CAMNT_0022085181 /DNA_START=60 /DNA_END=635 /DNA_ORIENTATION=+
MAMVHINKDMVEKLHTFMKEKGVFGIMPPIEQLKAEGMDDVVEHIDELGGVMSACKALKLLLTIPKSRNGSMKITRPGATYGQVVDTRTIELTEETIARLDAIRESKEYTRRRHCVNLGKDLFLEDLKIRLAAKAKAQAEGGDAAEGATHGASQPEGVTAEGASVEEGKKRKGDAENKSANTDDRKSSRKS